MQPLVMGVCIDEKGPAESAAVLCGEGLKPEASQQSQFPKNVEASV
jgi:hypothetical protein